MLFTGHAFFPQNAYAPGKCIAPGGSWKHKGEAVAQNCRTEATAVGNNVREEGGVGYKDDREAQSIRGFFLGENKNRRKGPRLEGTPGLKREGIMSQIRLCYLQPEW